MAIEYDLGYALEYLGWTRYRFAQALGIAYHNVFRLCRKGVNPTLATINKHAEILGIDTLELLKIMTESKKRVRRKPAN